VSKTEEGVATYNLEENVACREGLALLLLP
jgi:hypothetical protein